MVCRGVSLQLLNKSFQLMSYGIHGTHVMPGEARSDGYDAISVHDSVFFS